eukprot:671651-Amphidinium_carterae.2
MNAWNHAWDEYLRGKSVQTKEHNTPRGERVAPQQEVFAPFRRPASLILRQLSNFLTDLRSVIIANKDELSANGAWERVVSLCPKLSKRFGVPKNLPVAGSYEEVRDGVLEATVRHFQSVLDAERAHAISEARDAFRLALHQYGGSNKVVSRIANGRDAYPDVCVILEDGTSTYHPQKVLARASSAWSRFTAQQQQEVTDTWHARYVAPLVPTDTVPSMPQLTGESLLAVVKNMKARTSPGPDSWRVAELRALPLSAWTELAAILNEAESTGRWPQSLLDGVTTLIPKDEAAQPPLKLRPIIVLSCIYRCWASHRVQDLSDWLQEIMPVQFQAYLT